MVCIDELLQCLQNLGVAWVAIGRGCLLDVSVALMTLPYLLLLLVHSGKCFKSALTLQLVIQNLADMLSLT